MTVRTSALVLVAAALLSCSRDAPPTVVATAAPGEQATALATPGERAAVPDARMLEPLTALGPCKPPPDGQVDREVRGMVLPDGAVVTSVAQADPLTNVEGYIAQTPVQIRVFYEQHPALRVLDAEDEVRESEVLADVGEHRLFVKAQAVCELGSVFVAIVSPAAAPTP